MNFPYFISRRITQKDTGSFSSTISRLAIISISIGLSVMVLSFFILGGFQRAIKNKIYDFKGHIEISKFDMGSAYDEQPISVTPRLINQIKKYDFVDHIQCFAHKAGMIKANEEVEGILFKGVSSNYAINKFSDNMVAGRFIDFADTAYSKEIVLSKWMANRLSLETDSQVTIYFLQNPPRVRRLRIVGLYDTGLEEIDRSTVIGDISLLQKLNNWPDSLVGGIEVFVDNVENIEKADQVLYENLDSSYYVEKVSSQYSQIFDWLGLLDQNVNVFLGLILIVACFNIISILLILIMERTHMVGVFQALGASQRQIKKVFLFNGMILICKGILIGNIISLGIAYFQDKFHVLPLDADNYYMSFVPIFWDIKSMVLLNLLTFAVVSLALIVPLSFISRMSPVSAIKFD